MNRLDALIRATLDDHAEEAPPANPVVNRVLADQAARRRRRPAWAAASAASAAAVTVVAVGVSVTHDTDSPPQPGLADHPRSSGQHQEAYDPERTVAIYTAALERFLRESRDHFLDHDIPRHVWVGIRPSEDPGIGEPGAEIGAPLPSDIRDDISAELADLTTLEWSDRLPVQQSKATITLGLIPQGQHRVTVEIWGLQGFDNGWLRSYVMERSDSDWEVTGPGGTSAVT